MSDTAAPFTKRILIAVAIAIAAVALLLVMRTVFEVLLLIFAGVLLGIFINGTVATIGPQGKYWHRGKVLAFLLLSVAAVVGLFWYGIPNFADQVSNLGEQLKSDGEELRKTLDKYPWAQRLIDATPGLPAMIGGGEGAMNSAQRILSSTLGGLANFGIIVAVGLFCAWSPRTYLGGLKKLAPPQHRDAMADTLETLGQRLWLWTLARLLSMAVIGVSVAIGLAIIGVPMPIVLGVIAGLLTFIPNIGAILAVIPPVLLAFQSGTQTVVAVLIFYAVLQILESNVITPLIMKKAVELPPALLISAQAILGIATGIIGVALAAPLSVTGIVLVQELYVKPLENDDA